MPAQPEDPIIHALEDPDAYDAHANKHRDQPNIKEQFICFVIDRRDDTDRNRYDQHE